MLPAFEAVDTFQHREGDGVAALLNDAVSSPTPLEKEGQRARLIAGKRHATAHHDERKGVNIDWRPLPGSAEKSPHPIGRTPTESTSTSTSTSNIADGAGRADLWRVKLGGDFLGSSSYGSLHDHEEVHSHTTRTLRRLKLNSLDDDDRCLSMGTTKVSDFCQKRMQTRPLQRAMPTTYYRPVDSLATEGISLSPATSSLPLPINESFLGSRRDMPSELSVTIDTLPSTLSSVSYNSWEYTSPTPHNNNIMRGSNLRRNDLRKVAIAESTSESDDDSELKRMESVTHTYQRKDGDGTGRNSKSFHPLSGIGVDVKYNIDEQQRQHIHTPREATNASCSFSSFLGDLLGVTHPKEDGATPRRSPFNIVNMLCHDCTHNAEKAPNKRGKKIQTVNDDADGWSVGDDIRSDSPNRYTGGDCDSTRSES
mmetsp:Transcript_1633/g.4117  ORF Transcript_1633/g.4117 Transcript_1633/m.4117 type:complete len:425 (+) Transcript_1633:291-1565(+)